MRKPSRDAIDPAEKRELLAAAESAIAAGDDSVRPAAAAIRIEIAIAEAELPLAGDGSAAGRDPFFRLRASRWGMVDGELAWLYPRRDPKAWTLRSCSQRAGARESPTSATSLCSRALTANNLASGLC